MASSDVLVIDGGDVLTPAETIRGGRVVIVGGRIAAVGRRRDVRAPAGARTISARGRIVLPGLIETHAHGLCGADCMEGADAIVHMRRSMPRFGVTGFLPTFICAGAGDLARRLEDVRAAARADVPGARILGVHMEGPYFNSQFGAFPSLHSALPPARAQERMIRQMRGLVKIVTLSPELPGGSGFIRRLKAAGIVAAIGHSGATEEQLAESVDAGARHVIHLFDAMRRRSHEEPGTEWPALADLILLEDRLTAELIVDGIHVKPALLRLAARCKGVDKLVLVTDSMKAAGLGPGRYMLEGGLEVVSDGESCRTAKEKWLAGSVLTLDRAVLNMTRMARVPLAQAVQMATVNPARLIRAHRRTGALAPGMDADVFIADADIRAETVIVRGEVVFTAT